MHAVTNFEPINLDSTAVLDDVFDRRVPDLALAHALLLDPLCVAQCACFCVLCEETISWGEHQLVLALQDTIRALRCL